MVCISTVVDLLKKTVVFVLLICCPEACSYLAIITNKVWHSLSLALQKIKLSYAKSRCVSLSLFWHIDTPLIFPLVAALFINPCSPSVHIRKKYAESGSPYLSPLEGVIWPKGSPFIRTEYDVVVMHTIISSTQLSWKHIFTNIFSINDHFILSYALLISSFKAIKLVLPLLWFLM